MVMDYFNDLPPELLLRIFSFYIGLEGHRKFLKNIPLVCKRWKDAFSTPSLWKNVLETGHWENDEIVKLSEKGLLYSAQSVRFYNEREMLQIIPHCPNLVEVELFDTSLSKDVMRCLAEHCHNINTLNLVPGEEVPEDLLGLYLCRRGQKLKNLCMCNIFFVRGKNLISAITKYCRSLEELMIFENFTHDDSPVYYPRVQFPVEELTSSFQKLRSLQLRYNELLPPKVPQNCHNGFDNMVSFRAVDVDFHGLELHSILKSSNNLRDLQITGCHNVILNGISSIPSDKVEILYIMDQDLENSSTRFLEKAVDKWKRTLTSLCFDGLKRDLTGVLDAYLHENPNPLIDEEHLSDIFNSCKL